MQYLGGKARIAKRIASVINAHRGSLPVWEPFCGGAWMTRALGGIVYASDAHPGLIALYNEVIARGVSWLPDECTRDIWEAAKALPAHDPFAAFVGFGCSFGGSYFRSPALGLNGSRTYAAIAKSNLAKIAECAKHGADFTHASFFDFEPRPGVIGYLDPPYAGTCGYSIPFDHSAFYARVREWAEAGSIMFVSEYSFPFGEIVWTRTAKGTVGASHGKCKTRTENLYLIT